jgi:hypothetical protein
MVQLTFKRYETKFVLTDDQRVDLMRLMRSHVSADEYGPSTVCNVYYDTPSFLLARRSLEGPIYKEKIRARSYGVCNGHTPVFVELKKKYDGIVYKRRCTLSQIDAKALLSGARVPQDQIERELDYAICRYEGLSPAAFIAYDREGFYDPLDHDFRMTFDRRVRVRWDHLTLDWSDHGRQVLPDGQSILEVKTSKAMPLWLVRFLSEEGIRKTTWSKYGTAYCALYRGTVSPLGSAAQLPETRSGRIPARDREIAYA